MGPLTIGAALGERRRELGLDQSKAANAIGVNRSTYAAYERDARRLSAEVLRPLAEFLALSLEEILKLYAATCVTQARRVLFGEPSSDSEPVVESAKSDSVMRRAARGDDMSVVQRVYFDARAAHDHLPGRSMAVTVSDGPTTGNLVSIDSGRTRDAIEAVPRPLATPKSVTTQKRDKKKRRYKRATATGAATNDHQMGSSMDKKKGDKKKRDKKEGKGRKG